MSRSIVIPKSFEYVSPASIEDALAYLDEYGQDSKVLAGGMSLIPLMKLRLASPKYLIDINRISSLEYVKVDGDSLRIGPLTRHHAIQTSDLLEKRARIMIDAASMIGDPQVRNSGTIGGSLVHADPSADWGSVMIALDATLKLASSSGERNVRAEDFFVDSLTSAVKANELLSEIQIPLSMNASGGSYQKLERKAGDFATVGVAAQLSLDKDGVCDKVGIALSSVGPTNLKARKAEDVLRGHDITKTLIEEAAKAASEESKPSDDILRGSAEYKKAMVRVFAERALTQALDRAKNKEQ